MLLKRILTFLMLVAVLNQTFNTVSTLVAFQVNRQYITEMLCINKNRPELECHGKCVLMQRMQADIDKAQAKGQQMLQKLIENEVVLFFEDWILNINHTDPHIDIKNETLISMSDQNHSQSHLSDIFRPPIFA